MEQITYQELNRKTFSDHIADPSAISTNHSQALEGLIEKFPYSQLLRSFYTRSLLENDPLKYQEALAKTALFTPDRTILRTIIENAGSLTGSQEIEENIETEGIQEEQISGQEERVQELSGSDELIEERVEETGEDVQNEDAEETNFVIDEQGSDEQANLIGAEETIEERKDEDELDLLIKQGAVPADFLRVSDIEETTDPAADKPESALNLQAGIPERIDSGNISDNQQRISKYDDDKLPYSFLWWLNKTRKEHTENYQPYVSFQLDTTQSIKRNTVDQLSSQIIENIFHLQSPVDQLENAPRTVPFQVKRKEDHILEKFIREEPQIKAPNSDKLDIENKARKSAEDPNDLVSETLAQIYTDQMLFLKAIDTYKKLSLKFPEKSPYFADQIRDLEKKIN